VNSSKVAAATPASGHPDWVIDHCTTILLPFAASDIEVEAIRAIVTMTLPPPNLSWIQKLIHALRRLDLIEDSLANAWAAYAARNRQNQALDRPWQQKLYPVSATLMRLCKLAQQDRECGVLFIRKFLALVQDRPPPTQFSGHMYYKHIIAYRDACELYPFAQRTYAVSPGSDAASSLDPLSADAFAHPLNPIVSLERFATENAESALHKPNTRQKFLYVVELLQGSIRFGEAAPRGPIARRPNAGIGTPVQLAKATLQSIDDKRAIQSTTVSSPLQDDTGVTGDFIFPATATTRDKHHITRRAHNGFKRTNVRTIADMNALSRVTYQRYLIFAAANLEDSKYALVWLSAFPGIDVSRPFKIKKTRKVVPHDDEILIDEARCVIEYNILRRRDRLDPRKYETAGRMCLPIPRRVCSGLLALTAEEPQRKAIAATDQLAKRFAAANAGLSPTLRRLRASARLYLAPLAFSELTFCAVAGRVLPALKGISAYYPHQQGEIVKRFDRAYRAIVDALSLGHAEEIVSPVPASTEPIFCKPSPGISVARDLLALIAERYERECSAIARQAPLVPLRHLVALINIHETACYVVQQLVTGLRPIGQVANLVTQQEARIAMVRDKSSMTAMERSYSPIGEQYRELLRCSQFNRKVLIDFLRATGLRLILTEERTDLACELCYSGEHESVTIERMTNRYFHTQSCVASYVSDYMHQPNWLRHVATEYFADKAPQWMLDEFFSHMRIGRQPLGRWSTAGAGHFEQLRRRTDQLLREIVDPRLLLRMPMVP